MPDIWYRGEGVGVPQSTPGSTPAHDLGDGMYLTDRLDVAKKYAEIRATSIEGRRVYSVPVDLQGMRVLDLTTDPRWQKFMEPVAPGLPSNESLIRQANENYGKFFQSFVKKEKINLDEFDAVIGHEYVRGGKQVSILFKGSRPSSLQVRLRGTFRPVGESEGLITTSTPKLALSFKGKIGPGLKLVGGALAILGLELLIAWLKSKWKQHEIE